MRKWTKEHKRFIGRVIFANFLKIPLWKYRDIIKEVEGELYSKKGNGIGVTVRELSKEVCSAVKTKKSSKAVAEIVEIRSKRQEAEKQEKDGGFSIRYTDEGFNRIYITKGLEHSALFYKLRRISSRNEITHKILEGIVEGQKDFLTSANEADLKPFNQAELVKWLKQRQFKADVSWTSRLVNRISVITPWGEERILRSFFQTRKDVNKRLIKKLFDKENEDLQSGKLKKPYTDNELKTKLEVFFSTNYELRTKNYSLSRHTIGTCRRQMGIPIANRRLVGYKYPPLSANFSMIFAFARESVRDNTPSVSGVYELRLKGKEIDYPNSKTDVVYLGSAKNLRKRIQEHLNPNTKNGQIRDFLKNGECSFRYLKFPKNWREEEAKLYSLFLSTYGAAPRCNKVRPYCGRRNKSR